MSEDEPTCSACGRREEKCVCDWPMTTAAEAVETGIRTGRCGAYAVEPGGDWPMPPKEKP